jgi:uncharacterized protein YndB with AHSA1/START domain
MTTRPPLGATERSTPSGTGLASVLNGYLDRHRPSEEVVVAYASREIAASTADVYAVLIDPRSYPSWLAGAKEIREVDADWPAPGSRFHHRVRFGPITVADSAEMIAAQPCQRIELAVRARPFVSAIVTFALVGDDRRVHGQLRGRATGTPRREPGASGDGSGHAHAQSPLPQAPRTGREGVLDAHQPEHGDKVVSTI